MSDLPHLDTASLDDRERRHLRRAVRSLEAIPAGGSASAIFHALRLFAPVTGGMVGVMGARVDGSSVSHAVNLPGEVLEGWARTPRPHLIRMMAPLVEASPGDLISDRMTLTGRLRDEVELLRVLDAAGLGEAAGYKVASRTTFSGEPEHHFLTVALERGEVFTPRRRQLFRLLQPAVLAALSRLTVPLTAAEPILSQIIAEGRIGYLCLSPSGAIVELNARAHELIFQYLPLMGIEPGRGSLDRFAERAMRQTAGGRTWRLFPSEAPLAAEISAHRISRSTPATERDLTLIMLREIETSPGPHLALPQAKLTPRQREVARLLAATELAYKEIAGELGIAEGTMRKHAESVYRAHGVTSRAALMVKLR